MTRTTNISIYLFILNGLHISNEDQIYTIPNHIEDVVCINNKSVDDNIERIYDLMINDANQDDYILNIFDEIINEPTNDIHINKINKKEMKLPNYIFYPELYRHKYQLIMGVYHCIIQIPINNKFVYEYKEVSKLYDNKDLDADKTRTYTYSYLFNQIIRDHKESHIVGLYISNLNDKPLVDKIIPKYNLFNNIEFLGPNEINNNIEPLSFIYPYHNMNDLWNGNIAQYVLGCAISTLLYYKIISYDFAITELSKISSNGTSIWRLLEYCIIHHKMNHKVCVCRFPIKIGYLLICDYLLKNKEKNAYIIFKTCKNTTTNHIYNDHGHTCSILKLNDKLYIADPFFNVFDNIKSLKNIKDYYMIESHTHIDIPFKMNEKGITLKQLKELKGEIRIRPTLSNMSFGGK